MDSLIIKAAKFAKEAHKDQKRKYTGQPYITHPMRVAGQVTMLEGSTPEMVAAAYLHDVIEDTPTTRQMLADNFGDRVADLVWELTNHYTKEAYPKINRKERKTQELQRLSQISSDAKIIKMLDRYDNLKEIDPHDDFTAVYLDESLQLWEKLHEANAMIGDELHELIFDRKWEHHSYDCSDCESYPVSAACEIGAEILRAPLRKSV